jgi:hypothetical protein
MNGSIKKELKSHLIDTVKDCYDNDCTEQTESIIQTIDCINFASEHLKQLLVTENKALHLLILNELEKINSIKSNLTYLLEK